MLSAPACRLTTFAHSRRTVEFITAFYGLNSLVAVGLSAAVQVSRKIRCQDTVFRTLDSQTAGRLIDHAVESEDGLRILLSAYSHSKTAVGLSVAVKASRKMRRCRNRSRVCIVESAQEPGPDFNLRMVPQTSDSDWLILLLKADL